ncbi:MAG: GNAT family N-acetyltransferase [Verrucomicrobiota bacterium]
MTRILIRRATSVDAEAISELLSELGYSQSPADTADRINTYQQSSDTVLVADLDGQVAGFLSFHPTPLFHAPGHLGRITAMCVSQEHQRQGIGRALLEKLDHIAAEQDCHRIEVTSGDHRANDAHHFYQSCGYEATSQRFLKILT